MKNTSTFKSKHSNIQSLLNNENSNCNFKMVVYLIECSVSGKQYNGSTTKFRRRAYNYKSTHRNFWKEQIKPSPYSETVSRTLSAE